MDMIQEALFDNAPAFIERRAARRAPCPLEVTVRQRGCFAVAGVTADLTPYGARLSGAGPFEANSELWLHLPGLENQSVRVIWSRGATTGVAFDHPLHNVEFARMLPSGSRLTLVDAASEIKPEPAQDGPLLHTKQPAGGGLANTIRRGAHDHAEHRREERFAEELQTGPMLLKVGAYPAQVRDVSASGLRVAAPLEVAVGARVAVEFDGFDAMAGQVMWRNADEMGLSLPPDSLELLEA